MSDAEQLGKIRDRIDAIDEQVHQLLNQRAEAAMEVARIKLSADPNAVFYRPEREAQVLRMVQKSVIKVRLMMRKSRVYFARSCRPVWL